MVSAGPTNVAELVAATSRVASSTYDHAPTTWSLSSDTRANTPRGGLGVSLQLVTKTVEAAAPMACAWLPWTG